MRIVSDWFYWFKIKFMSIIGKQSSIKDDDFWFHCMLSPARATKYCEIDIPGLPPDAVQQRFTGRSGYENLNQAYQFYQFVSEKCELSKHQKPKILDFGGGWGRISRFFLRDTSPESIFVADVLSDSIHWLSKTGAKFTVVQNNPLPPITGLDHNFSLIYAFSVFSHLSEEYFRAWVSHLIDLLQPGGYLVFTTRGREFIGQLEKFRSQGVQLELTTGLPTPDRIRERYDLGELQFYPLGGGGELSDSFYGETFIPRDYLESTFGNQLKHFTESVPLVDQAVCVIQKAS